ncbi:hypothetical protein Q8F55_007243 [Vanrija albida]|uniref:Isopenicillin N synthase-like Fe(2+) 2OG dioxygenase domain-containing protein n=1 Tax=Vanrija albida TaxID=181172 RepID=A0ABR3Q0A2_9TREE
MAPVAVAVAAPAPAAPVPDTAATLAELKALSPPPAIAPWLPPPTTTADLPWAELQQLDLNDLDDPARRPLAVAAARKGLAHDGFLFITGTGVSTETLQRNLSIAKFLVEGLTLEQKTPWKADLAAGSYKGFKVAGEWSSAARGPDKVEHYNFESPSFTAPLGTQHPPELLPFIPEIKAFAEHTYNHVVYRILKLVSLALELPEDYLWGLHDHTGNIGHACSRYMGYYPLSDAEAEAGDGVLSRGHTDYNSISLLYSQPVSALQLLTNDGQWKWVKHVDGAVVVNTADALEFLSGGLFKATRHRVVRPPPDQQQLIRYILIHFARTRRDLPLDPIWDSPVVKAHGKNQFQDRIDAGGAAPTQDEWLRERIRRTGHEDYYKNNTQNKQDNKWVEEEVLGRKVKYFV